jgi:ankyrin repeat protein
MDMKEGHRKHNHHEECHHCTTSFNFTQTLPELEFERGLWSAAKYGKSKLFVYKCSRLYCRDGDIRTVQKLLDQGKNPSQKDSSGFTPLHYAARAGHTNVSNPSSELTSIPTFFLLMNIEMNFRCVSCY